MRNRSILDKNMVKVFLRLLYSLCNRSSYLFAFTLSHTNPTFAIANDDESGKLKTLSSLHHFRHTINEHDSIF